MAAKALVFDLDGTLWDSFVWYGAALSCLCNASQAEVTQFLRDGQNLVSLVDEFGVTRRTFDTACRESLDELELYPGVLESLTTLAKRGTPMGIATNVPRRVAQPVLAHFDLPGLFGSIVYNARKPSGAGIVQVITELGLAPAGDIFYVGDMQSDATAAAKAHVSFAWASYGYSDEPPAGAQVEIEHFSNVIEL